jgi:predicted RNA binding protein YcfA (HicA-like mRNA interferase family)
MAKLPRISGRQTVAALERLGFVQVRQRGSHVILKRRTPAGDIVCPVPLHPELAIGTLRGILRLARVDVEEFIRQL